MEKTSTGLQENVASLLCYLVGWISGLVFFLIEKENKTVRFHALQSLVFSLAATIIVPILLPTLAFIPILGWIVAFLIPPGLLAIWIVLMVTAFQGKKIKIPLAAKIAEKYA